MTKKIIIISTLLLNQLKYYGNVACVVGTSVNFLPQLIEFEFWIFIKISMRKITQNSLSFTS
jgi:hypothetical protein